MSCSSMTRAVSCSPLSVSNERSASETSWPKVSGTDRWANLSFVGWSRCELELAAVRASLAAVCWNLRWCKRSILISMVSGTKKIKNGGRDVKKRFIRTRKGNIKFFFFFFRFCRWDIRARPRLEPNLKSSPLD